MEMLFDRKRSARGEVRGSRDLHCALEVRQIEDCGCRILNVLCNELAVEHGRDSQADHLQRDQTRQ
jgi:hypothetical protein